MHIACRDKLLANWKSAPSARACHPREEHLLPVHVAAGAAGGDKGAVDHEDEVMGVAIASYVFGAWPEVAAAS